MDWIAKIGAILRSIGSFGYRQVLRGGKMVWELFRVSGEPIPAQAALQQRDQAVDDYDGVKRLAAAMMLPAGPKPDDFKCVPELTVKWLRSLDRADLAKVAVADGKALRGHFRGGVLIKGMVPYDAAAIADVTAAKRAPDVRKDREMTLEDLLEQNGLMPA